MKHLQIQSVGGLAKLAPKQLEQKLASEGYTFVDQSFVEKHASDISKVCRKRAHKNKPRYFITGKAGSIGKKPNEPVWYQGLRVQKTRAGFYIEFVYLETVTKNDLLIFNSKVDEVKIEEISVATAQS